MYYNVTVPKHWLFPFKWHLVKNPTHKIDENKQIQMSRREWYWIDCGKYKAQVGTDLVFLGYMNTHYSSNYMYMYFPSHSLTTAGSTCLSVKKPQKVDQYLYKRHLVIRNIYIYTMKHSLCIRVFQVLLYNSLFGR